MRGLLDVLNSDEGQLGLSLLAAAGPSAVPMSFGQRLQGAMGQFNAQRQAAAERELLKQYRQMQMETMQSQEERAKQQFLSSQQLSELQLQAARAEAQKKALLTSAATDSVETPTQTALRSFGGPTVAAAEAAPTANPGFNWGAYKNRVAGIDPMMALQIETALKREQPKLKSVEPMRSADGKLVNVALFEDGTTKVLPYGVKPEIALQSLGNRVVALDKNNLPTGASFDMGQSPDSVASNKLGWANYELSKDRFTFDQGQANQGVTYQQDANGNFVALPTKAAPGSIVRATPVVAPGAGMTPLEGKGAGMTDAQSKALLFGTRAQESNTIINQLATEGVTQRGLIKRGAETIPFVGGTAGALTNWTQSDEQQQVEQAQRDFINAVLRRESGAVISEGEFENARQQYFPQIGDSEKVMKQKADNRKTAIEGILAEVPTARRPSGQPGGFKIIGVQ